MAYSPLGHGFFGGKGIAESLPTESILVYEKHMSVFFLILILISFLIAEEKNNEMLKTL